MTIYYNSAYSALPFRDRNKGVEFGNVYCGDMQLLRKLLFYAGIPYLAVSDEERLSHYHSNMMDKLKADSPFYTSFKIDSAGMSRRLLQWRDELVRVGWDVKKYKGDSIKLSLIRDMEPETMPLGESDYWNLLLNLSLEKKMLPDEIDIVATCGEYDMKPHIVHILKSLQNNGVKVDFRPVLEKVADGNLGKIQDAVIDGSVDKIVLDDNDRTFRYMLFDTDDDALRYVATESLDASAVYYCSKPKRFDNTLKLLGKPTIGSSLSACSPQVMQLFILGNGLFEYPLNIHRIIEWLNMPISPIDSGLRNVLSNALINSGGINNKVWNDAVEQYLNTIEDEKERKKILQQYTEFLPLHQSEDLDVECVKEFNRNLSKWAVKLLSMDNFPYDDIVREQISAINNNAFSLVKMLDKTPADFKFLDLQLWCRNIAQPGVYAQYGSELGCHNTIASMGDIHDIAENVVWFPAEDEGLVVYPFDMLNDKEFDEVKDSGAKIYDREQHTRIHQSARLRMLLNTKRLTIIESRKSNGEKTVRHPLVLQLNERIDGGLKKIAENPILSEYYRETDKRVINSSDNPLMIKLNDVKLKERHERYDDDTKKAESYSSLDLLIQHPFRYVCEKCAQLDDKQEPSAQDLNRTLGNVAHLIIEKVFDGKSIDEAKSYFNAEYETIFENAVNENGLLLYSPEHAIELRRLKLKMKTALQNLADFIENNNLIVEKCEYEFKPMAWKEAGENVMLSSRTDMLLKDNNGGKVILDFKWSNSKKYYRTVIEENRALQLELYRFMAKLEFGNENVRVAYVQLPEVEIITSDGFENITSVKSIDNRCVMDEAANSYKFRWNQLKNGNVERVEGQVVGTGDYGAFQGEKKLFPLSVDNKTNIYSKDKFDKGYKNLK